MTIHAGFVVDNPVTKIRLVVLESKLEAKGRGWLIELHCQPGSKPGAGEHLHLTWTETFEIISGTAYYRLDGKQHTAQAGGKFVVLPRQRHVHPWNAGDTEMVYRHNTELQSPDPQAMQATLGVFATLAGLAREGKVDKNAFPKHPLQLGATLKPLTKYGSYDASLPILVLRFMVAVLGSLAGLLGYKAIYPQYVSKR